jgi:hypothetical protein
VDSARYECPAAHRLRNDIADAEARLMSCAERLNTLADALQRAAGTVRDDQAWWRQEFERLSAELTAAARGH